MGGLGSGNHTRKRGDTLEAHRKVDAFRFRKAGLLTDGWVGKWQWKSADGETNAIDIAGGRSEIVLTYKFRQNGGDWQPVRQTIAILYHACHFGGHQVYFGCPGCARRVRFLYGAGALFQCRHCYDLVYASSREGAVDRECRRIRKLRRKVQSDENIEGAIIRPKHMRASTFEPIFDEIIEREDQLSLAMDAKLMKSFRTLRSAAGSTSKGFWT